jgi:hypothetical protein
MITIYKYEVGRWGFDNYLKHEERSIVTPGIPLIRNLDRRQMGLYLWAEVDTEAKPLKYDVVIVPTGGQVYPGFFYAGQVRDGPFEWHIHLSPTR